MTKMTKLKVEFVCGSGGFHQYSTVWNPVLNELLSVRQEKDNPYDRYAIAVLKTDPYGQRTSGWSFTTRNFEIFMVHNQPRSSDICESCGCKSKKVSISSRRP